MLSRSKNNLSVLAPAFEYLCIGLVILVISYNIPWGIHALSAAKQCSDKFPGGSRVLPKPEDQQAFDSCFRK
jgi:hypothetical protein